MRSLRWVVLLWPLLAAPVSARVWTDSSGTQQAEAEFVALDGDLATFRLPDGELRRCELDRLSAEDRHRVVATALAQAIAPSATPRLKVQLVSASQPAPAAAPQVETSATTSVAACPPAGCAPAPATYECVVMVPQLVTEMRTITVCEWRDEQRQSTYTACRMVPETQQVTYEYTVPTYETRTREFVYSVFKPVLSTRDREYTVMVPHTEKRQGTRRECHMVPVEMTRTVCEDHGSWQQVVRQACGCCCGSCTWVCNLWVPKYEKREVKYTVMRPQMHDVPYEYDVTVCKPEKRTQTIQVCNYVQEQQKRSVPYTVCVPVKKTGTREVTNYRRVEEQKVHNYTVRVPYPVQKQVPVQVCRMVAKKVTMQAPVCGPSYGCCGGGWGGGCGGRGCW